MFHDEFEYFIQHQDELVKQYGGRVIVIKDKQIVGDYATELEAYNASQKKYPVGTFFIQRCQSGADAYTQAFHSRIVFAQQ